VDRRVSLTIIHSYGSKSCTFRVADWRSGRPPLALETRPPADYLVEDDVIDVSSELVTLTATRLALRRNCEPVEFARHAFEFVRDEIDHAGDVEDRRVPVSASETLRHRVGLCYAKAHLLVALLRVAEVPAGLCYQRLLDRHGRHVVHGLLAVFLNGAWHRLDPRGNRAGIDAQFSLGRERLAYPVRPELGECDYPRVFIRPHPVVIAVLVEARDNRVLCAGGLPSKL
jgi:transglutaminase-like putative cysteine protease